MDMFYFCNDGVWDNVDGGRTFAAVTYLARTTV